jgi:hypothetical protein
MKKGLTYLKRENAIYPYAGKSLPVPDTLNIGDVRYPHLLNKIKLIE